MVQSESATVVESVLRIHDTVLVWVQLHAVQLLVWVHHQQVAEHVHRADRVVHVRFVQVHHAGLFHEYLALSRAGDE